MRVMGIDASLQSTGICVCDLDFDPDASEAILRILLDSNAVTDSNAIAFFKKCVSVVLATQIQPPKDANKALTKIRKKIRDDTKNGEPSMEDIQMEDSLVCNRIKFQVHEILDIREQYRPDITLIEDYSYGSNGSIVQLAEMKGYLRCVRDFDIITANINSVKKVGSTKGNATKQIMFQYIQRFPVTMTFVEGNDDEIDALAICLTAFYSIYYRVLGFDFPIHKKAKDRLVIKSWKESLEKFANHMGNKTDLSLLVK